MHGHIKYILRIKTKLALKVEDQKNTSAKKAYEKRK